MSIDYAHTPIAEQQRAAKAQILARWCYSHGLLDDRILHATPQLRRASARSAGVTPPHENDDAPGETWQIVVELLTRKLAWDRDHCVTSPRPARCLECAIRGDWCEQHEPRTCTVCSGPLAWVFLEEGSTTHPSCDLDADHPAKQPAADQTPTRPDTQLQPAGDDATLF